MMTLYILSCSLIDIYLDWLSMAKLMPLKDEKGGS